MKSSRALIMTIPNLLTISRILLTPLLAWLLLEAKLGYALLVFLAAGATDGLDGFIARLCHQKSQLGAYLDPLADKLLLVSSFILLSRIDLIPSWLVVVTVGRDLVIVAGCLILVLYHVPIQVKPVLSGKLSTMFQLLTVLGALSSPFVPIAPPVQLILVTATALLAIVSGVQYVRLGLSLVYLHRTSPREVKQNSSLPH
jgi:cardiolipin synthase (CMP-forming)